MATRLRFLHVAGAAALLTACAPGLAVPADADVTRGRPAHPDLTLDELNQGRSKYVAKCAGCHHLYSPAALEPESWRGMVAEMRDRSNLTDAEEQAILTYLTVMSTRPQG
ncbi:MAG: hypothetical protein IV100_05975 [Myxococcales bacterium]|nr:hypothetical protein [Myxococcales bacterium]